MSTDRTMVSREKYEKAKKAARDWFSALEKAKEENDNLKETIEDYEQKSDAKQSKIVKELKSKLRELEEKNKNKIAELEREKLLLEGRVQRLEEYKKDLQERYSDLKQDYREMNLRLAEPLRDRTKG